MIPVILGLVGLAATAVIFIRTVIAIRAHDRAVVTAHLQSMRARGR